MIEWSQLISKAKEAAEFSYSPYSKFKVGAAVLTKEGKIFEGCNVENLSFGATVCAERTAVLKAVSQGYRQFEAIAVYSPTSLPNPCGICRQFLAEFSPDMTVIVCDKNNERTFCLSELLPFGFEAQALQKKRLKINRRKKVYQKKCKPYKKKD